MDKKHLNLYQISDTHLFRDLEGKLCGQQTLQSLEAVLDTIKKDQWPADYMIVTGDISQDGSEESYHHFKKRISAFDVPTYCLPGNHDSPEVMGKVYKDGPIQVGRHLVKGNWQIVMLNSTIPNQAGGNFRPEELSFLEDCLKEKKENALVCFHHSPVELRSGWMDSMRVNNSDQFINLIKSYPQVKGVVWGHIHQEYDELHEGIRFLGTPSTCIQFKPKSNNFGFDRLMPGYRKLTLHEDGRIDSEIKRVENFDMTVDFNSKGY